MRGLFHAWGQDPQRPGHTFETRAEAVAWAKAEAPRSCGWAFVEDLKTREIETFRAEGSR